MSNNITGIPNSQANLNSNVSISSLEDDRNFYAQQALTIQNDPSSSPDLIATTTQAAFNSDNIYQAALQNNQNLIASTTANQVDSYSNSNNSSLGTLGQSLNGGPSSGTSNSISSNGLSTTNINPSTPPISLQASQALQTVTQSQNVNTNSNNNVDFRIRLRPKSGINSMSGGIGTILYPLIATNGFMFPYTPTITWNQSVKYSTQETTHANQDYRAYVNTPALDFTIAGKFSAQNTDEALYLLASLHFLRSVTKMHFGNAITDTTVGTPPPVLLLSGYGQYMFNDLPIVVTGFSMDMGENVDYVPVTVQNIITNIPSLTTITLTCTVQNTPQKLRQFDWNSFANGSLLTQTGWF